MSRIVVISVLLCSLFQHVQAQHYIGLQKNVIKEMMRSKHKNLYLDDRAVNNTYNYLKYVDAMGEETLIYFLDKNDKCKLVRHICDYALLNEKIEALNESYTRMSENLWRYKENGNIYDVSLKEDEWYFTITARKQ